MPTNAHWIGFLRNYGPVSTNGNSFDESTERARRRAGIEPAVSLPEPLVGSALARLTDAQQPTSVILTGTAGDGKTYHCRRIWEHLQGDATLWAKGDPLTPGILEIPVGERTLLIVRDLTELNETTFPLFFERIFASLGDERRSVLFLIAANVGQLHDKWQAALRAHPDNAAARRCWQSIESQLFGERDEIGVVTLFDLSRGSTQTLLRDVLAQVLGHPAWAGCDLCELRLTERGPCPIWANRQRIWQEEGAQLLRDRLGKLVHLQAQNGRHLTVRHLLMLVANALLGHTDVKQNLLTCDDIAAVQELGTLGSASIYQNIFGENMPERQRANRELFDKLNRVGIGGETSNRIDRVLTYGSDDPQLHTEYNLLVGTDTLYGHTSAWQSIRDRYLENCDDATAAEFLAAIRRQRQRLFFTIPVDREREFGLWELTVYHYADAFLRTAEAVRTLKRIPPEVLRRLIRGLNRVFTGQLLQQDDRLVVASSGSNSQSKTSLLFEGEIASVGDTGERIEIIGGQRTEIALSVTASSAIAPALLDLTVLRFEFLSRVADGALPSSFSLECHEDMLAFKAAVLRTLEARRRLVSPPAPVRFRLLEIGADGQAVARHIEIGTDA